MTSMHDANRELLSAMVAASGLTIGEFARTVVGRDERTVRRWLTGATEIPEQMADWLMRTEVEANSRTVTIKVQR